MSKQEKLRRRFKSRPCDFTWDELKTLLCGMCYEQSVGGKTGWIKGEISSFGAAANYYAQTSSDSEAVGLNKYLLRNRLIGPYLRQLSTNRPAINSQIPINLVSNIQSLATVCQA